MTKEREGTVFMYEAVQVSTKEVKKGLMVAECQADLWLTLCLHGYLLIKSTVGEGPNEKI